MIARFFKELLSWLILPVFILIGTVVLISVHLRMRRAQQLSTLAGDYLSRWNDDVLLAHRNTKPFSCKICGDTVELKRGACGHENGRQGWVGGCTCSRIEIYDPTE